jgi:hypothetical protein
MTSKTPNKQKQFMGGQFKININNLPSAGGDYTAYYGGDMGGADGGGGDSGGGSEE